MSISDRVCPEHGDIGALPDDQCCRKCGKALVMKGTLRTAVESLPGSLAVGLGLGAGLEAGKQIVREIAGGDGAGGTAEAASGFLDSL